MTSNAIISIPSVDKTFIKEVVQQAGLTIAALRSFNVPVGKKRTAAITTTKILTEAFNTRNYRQPFHRFVQAGIGLVTLGVISAINSDFDIRTMLAYGVSELALYQAPDVVVLDHEYFLQGYNGYFAKYNPNDVAKVPLAIDAAGNVAENMTEPDVLDEEGGIDFMAEEKIGEVGREEKKADRVVLGPKLSRADIKENDERARLLLDATSIQILSFDIGHKVAALVAQYSLLNLDNAQVIRAIESSSKEAIDEVGKRWASAFAYEYHRLLLPPSAVYPGLLLGGKKTRGRTLQPNYRFIESFSRQFNEYITGSKPILYKNIQVGYDRYIDRLNDELTDQVPVYIDVVYDKLPQYVFDDYV